MTVSTLEFLSALYPDPVAPGKLVVWTSSKRSGNKHSYWKSTLDEAAAGPGHASRTHAAAPGRTPAATSHRSSADEVHAVGGRLCGQPLPLSIQTDALGTLVLGRDPAVHRDL